MTDQSAVLVTPDETARLAMSGAAVIDVQFSLTDTPGYELYAAAHLPGAPFLDLGVALAGQPGEGGRHPLPEPAMLQSALRECGVDDGMTVVVYDQRTSLSAARAWWTLRWGGIEDVRVLNGGLAAWQASGRPTTTIATVPPLGTVTVRPGSLRVLEADDAARVAAEGVLLDSRTPERFRGDVEPLDPVAGHIPGAVNAPMTEQLHHDGTFRSPEVLREYFESKGVRWGVPVGTTCGSGITAAHTALALHVAGLGADPYIGSWSQWITDPSRPVATGD